MKRRGFIGLVLGALGLPILPNKAPSFIHEMPCGTWAYLAQDFLEDDKKLTDLVNLRLHDAGELAREKIFRSFLRGNQ